MVPITVDTQIDASAYSADHRLHGLTRTGGGLCHYGPVLANACVKAERWVRGGSGEVCGFNVCSRLI